MIEFKKNNGEPKVIWFSNEREEIKAELVKLIGSVKENLYCSTMQDVHIFAYEPQYPKESKEDFVVEHFWAIDSFVLRGKENSIFGENKETFSNKRDFLEFLNKKASL